MLPAPGRDTLSLTLTITITITITLTLILTVTLSEWRAPAVVESDLLRAIQKREALLLRLASTTVNS